MLDTQKALEAIDNIQRALLDYTGGWKNEEALRKIQVNAQAIRYATESNAYISEKVGSLVRWTEILYSARKWQNYGGIDRVKHFAFLDCQRVRSWLPQLERAHEHTDVGDDSGLENWL